MHDLIIIGGGLAGLSAATYANERGLDFRLLESRHEVGGVIRSQVREDGSVYELGPNSLTLGPVTRELVDKLSLEVVPMSPKAKTKLICKRGTLRQPWELVSWWHVLAEALGNSKPSDREMSVADFFRQRFGQGMLDNLIYPMVTGIYAGDPERLSMRDTFPALWDMAQERGSLIRAGLSRARSGKRQISTFRHGLGSLPSEIARKLGSDRIQTNCTVERVELRDDRVIVTDRQGTRIQARRLICAVPAHQVRKLLPNVSEAVDKIPYRPLWTVVANCPLDLNDDYPYGDTFGFLAARDGGTRLLGVVFHSSTFPSLAPPDSHTLTCFLGGAKDPDIANLESTSVGELCLRELERVLWLECNLVATQFWPRAIPQYHLGHRDLVQQIETNLPPNVALAGNYLRGVSLEDTARSGRDALDSVGSP